ncbi:steroid receptor RNA activator 1-like [Plakobranchus ocellatus]|uniref:Steroid receptor RNA activator 1-like n=1 Tax=Plakobranchus ocellatus TaxID=259542 RepID=A0AAV4ADJ6_9GAST|nr:steroid receptor RNA activator 1-like [Plakobranchus ocellatus]
MQQCLLSLVQTGPRHVGSVWHGPAALLSGGREGMGSTPCKPNTVSNRYLTLQTARPDIKLPIPSLPPLSYAAGPCQTLPTCLGSVSAKLSKHCCITASGGKNDGWNDPPLLTFNPTSQATPPRNRLNKRVGFPLSASPSSSNPENLTSNAKDANISGMLLNPKDGPPKLPPVHILPPTMSTVVHPPVPVLVPTLSPPIDPSGLPPSFASAARDSHRSETLPELLERLDLDSADSLRKYTKKVLHEMVNDCQDSIQGRSREDVQARLGLLDDQWRDQKLSEEAKVKLGCLACALKNKDLKYADGLHLALMVDHISEVSQWMVGVKRLINELKLKLSDKPPPPSPKRLFFPGATPSSDNIFTDATPPQAPNPATTTTSWTSIPTPVQQQDIHGNEQNPPNISSETDNSSGLKPVLGRKVLSSGIDETDDSKALESSLKDGLKDSGKPDEKEALTKNEELHGGDSANITGH